MERIYVFIISCFAGIIGTSVAMIFGLHWSCMIGTIIFVVAIALSLDTYFKGKREEEEKLYAEIVKKDQTLSTFMQEFGVDQNRAEQLYLAGFHELEDFQGKSVQELMEIEDINPTLAKRIASKMKT